MTPDPDLARIERDRRRREELLLLLLLLYSTRALVHARSAVRVGANPADAAWAAIMGGSHVDGPPLGDRLLPLLNEVYRGGLWRGALLIGETVDLHEPGIAIPSSIANAAAELAQKTGEAVRRVTTAAIASARQHGLGTGQTLTLLSEAFKAAGLHRDNSSRLETGVERAVVTGYGAGMWGAWHTPGAATKVFGFVHRTILDGRETEICHERAGFARPRDDPYWRENWPSLHFGCRSVIFPVMKAGPWSTGYPINSPDPGFGRAPATAFGVAVGYRAA